MKRLKRWLKKFFRKFRFRRNRVKVTVNSDGSRNFKAVAKSRLQEVRSND